MTRAIFFGRVRLVGRSRALALKVAAAAALALCLLALQPAEAAFPGNNGKIVFWSNRSADPGLYELTVGGAATKITGTSAGDNHAVWSPDGSRIAFTSASRSNYEVSVMKADGSGRRQLTSTPVAEKEPTWSPDGTRIAFVRGGEIYAINVDGGGETNLTNNPADDSMPAWSPDGTRIAFVSGRSGDSNSNIYVMDTNPATADAVSLTANSTDPNYQGHDDHPSWSPDGSQIAYSNNGDGDADVYKMDTSPATKDWTNLTDGNLGVDLEPAWSPDGDSIAYVAVSGSTDRNIYVMDANAAGSGAAIDTTVANDISPDWQPDSTPPTVKGVSPTGSKVRPGANVAATFSEAMEPATLDDTTFKLVKKGATKATAARITYSAATAKATLNPARNLKSGATYRATVTTGAEDAAGNALAANKTWGFKVR